MIDELTLSAGRRAATKMPSFVEIVFRGYGMFLFTKQAFRRYLARILLHKGRSAMVFAIALAFAAYFRKRLRPFSNRRIEAPRFVPFRCSSRCLCSSPMLMLMIFLTFQDAGTQERIVIWCTTEEALWHRSSKVEAWFL